MTANLTETALIDSQGHSSADLRAPIYARVPLSAFGRREPEPAPSVRPPGSFQHRLTVMLRCEEVYREHLRFGPPRADPRS